MLASLDIAKIRRRARNEDVSTTLGYVKTAEDLTGQVGAPLPPRSRRS